MACRQTNEAYTNEAYEATYAGGFYELGRWQSPAAIGRVTLSFGLSDWMMCNTPARPT